MALNLTEYICRIEFQAGFKCVNSSLVLRKGVLVGILHKSVETKPPNPTREKGLFDFFNVKIQNAFL